MKKTKKLVALLACFSMLASVNACGNKNANSDGDGGAVDGAVVDVQIYNAGYGKEWLEKLGEAFAETYKDKGYTINITKAEKILNVDNEILTPKKTTTDLYFAGNFGITAAIDSSFSVLKTRDYTLVEDLTEVFYNSYAIGKDGQEETVKIKDKMNKEALQYTQYYGVNAKWKNKNYIMPWANSVTGFVVNEELLKTEFNLEIPVTTAEMIEDFEIIK